TDTTRNRTAYPPAGDAGVQIAYTDLASLTLRGGQGANLFDVASTPAGTAVIVYGGTAGPDQLSLGEDALLDGIQGPLTFHGQSADTVAVFNDLATAAARTYTLGTQKLQRTGMADVAFDGLSQIVLYTGTGPDTVNVL